MTRDEILAMPAGNLMDVNIACKVFGITNTLTHNYSTDIKEAQKVVMRLLSEWQYKYGVDAAPEIKGRGAYFCQLTGKKGQVTAFANTCPLAICRAALLAVTE